jgi:Fe-Mn family superoxide dismutase
VHFKHTSSFILSEFHVFIVSGVNVMKEYALPKLPYGYDALEPVIDKDTVTLHHDKHHAAYVTGFNSTLKKVTEAREKADYSAIKALVKDLSFHGSGVVLHNLYWENLCPKNECKEPISGDLFEQIKNDFGGLDKLKSEMGAAAKAVEGSGWAVLVWDQYAKQLLVLQVENHQKLTIWGVTPLLVVDVWEHAYYLKYQNNRAAYVDALWGIINWEVVEDRFRKV